MNNSGVIKTSKNPDLVTFTVSINGDAISGAYQVMSTSVSHEVNRISGATVVLNDGESSSENFELSSGDLFVPGNEIEITAGYQSDEELIFKGIIIKHSIKIRSAASYLILECKDPYVKTTIGRKSKFYVDSTDSEIIEQIADEYGLEHDIESTNSVHPEIIQYNASDWDFIVTRAQANGKLCFLEEGKLIVKAPTLDSTEVETVAFGSSMLDFDGEIDSRNQVSNVSSYTWNSTDQEMSIVEANNPNVELNGNLTSDVLSEVIGLDHLELKHGGKLDDVELQNWADAKLLYQQLSKVRGRVKFQGIPAVKPDTILLLEGVGDRFNGPSYITGVLHTLGDGNWKADAQFGLNPKWFSETYDINCMPAAGLVPAIKGLHVGVVSQLQDDPDGAERTLVRIPIVDGEEQGLWCRSASLDAGNNRGSVFRPEIGDEVIVGFINEDPNDAVMLGMLHSAANPSPIPASDDNNEKGFITRSDMKFIFDDDKISMTLETPSGKKITLDEDANEILIEDDHSNSITMNSDGIALDSAGDISIKASGDVLIEGLNVEIKANAEFKAEGAAGAEVSTSAIAVIKGSLVQIN
jgi:Rhs element Vgr protein